MTLLLTACGSGKSDDSGDTIIIGFPAGYKPPEPNYDAPESVDPNFKSLEPALVEPYWVSALKMDDGDNTIKQMLLENERTIKFAFPLESPDYLPLTILGWAPATQNMKLVSHEIFSNLEAIVDVKIQESEIADGFNILVISQSIQANSSGFGYFPNNFYQIGSDIFISKQYSEPALLQNNLTNYDYEVLLHEIGHALGLKHPFSADKNNQSILNAYEDQSEFTAMSYDTAPSTFDGFFRPLDLMTLTKFYGVNSNYNSEDNTYNFSNSNGVFIIDGAGSDTVSMPHSILDIFIDLRPGTHSYEGNKSNFITAAKQLTISHGSEIENVVTGSGNDMIIGNELSNTIVSGGGDDKIFPGEGNDIINAGSGKNIIDLSEVIQSRDRIIIEKIVEDEHYENIYGFGQGILGDILDVSAFDLSSLTILPIVDVLNTPSGYIDNCLVRLFGNGLDHGDVLETQFEKAGILDKFYLSPNKLAILITAQSQNTGEEQNIFYVEENSGSVEAHYLATLVGNYLDIDNWSAENF